MKRSMMHIYVKGSLEAAELYRRAFGAELFESYPDDNGNYLHAELDIQGQIVSLSESTRVMQTGNTMQFCLHMGEGHEAFVRTAYKVLMESGEAEYPLGACMFSPLMFGVTDCFGVRWCVFV